MWPRRVCWLSVQTGVRQARRRRVRVPSSAAANVGAEHPRERLGQPVHRASRSAAGSGMEARDTGPSMYPRSRSGQPIPPAPPSGDTGIGSAMGWINLNYASPPAFRLVGPCYAPPFGDPKGNVLRTPSAIGFRSGLGATKATGAARPGERCSDRP